MAYRNPNNPNKSRKKDPKKLEQQVAKRKAAKKKTSGNKRKLNGGHSTSTKKLRASTTGGPSTLPKVINQATWRQELQAARVKFDDTQKQKFLKKFAETGRLFEAARAADVTPNTIRNHLGYDPDFAESYENAKLRYREDVVHKTVHKVAIEGVLEPIIGGRFKDEVVAHKRVYATNILAMEMKRVDPSYRDRTEIDVTVKRGVLVMPAKMSEEDWDALYAKPVPDSGELIEHGEL